MTSCPAEPDLLALVDGDLDARRAIEVTAHLAECAACGRALAQAEAALCYALGGLADAERVATVRVPVETAVPLRQRLAALAAAALLCVCVTSLARRGNDPVARSAQSARSLESAALVAHLDRLLDDARRLARTPTPDEAHDAVAALASAEARAEVLGPESARSGYLRVIAGFPGSPQAETAIHALDGIATFGGTR
jgi:anti-sigma factor RsiW